MNEPKEPMPSVVASAILALVAGCVTYTIALRHGSVGIWYLPLARAWAFGQKPAGVAMSWFGSTACVFAAAFLGAALGRAVPRPGGRFVRIGGLLAGAALIVAVTTCVAANVDRPMKPLSSPDGRPVVCAPGP
jgi:uncharacterized membrane protein YbhN (UPF0104 family)